VIAPVASTVSDWARAPSELAKSTIRHPASVPAALNCWSGEPSALRRVTSMTSRVPTVPQPARTMSPSASTSMSVNEEATSAVGRANGSAVGTPAGESRAR
jgi:hypothetical protein